MTLNKIIILHVSEQAYWEIRKRMEIAGYKDQLIEKDGKIIINLDGIALSIE